MASKTQLKTREKGSGSVYKDGKRWYLKARINGVAKVKMLRDVDGNPCTSQVSAEKAANGYKQILAANSKAEMAVQVAEAKKLRRQSGLTVEKAWETFLRQDRPELSAKSLHDREREFNVFCHWLTDNHPEITLVSHIESDIAEEYFASVWNTGVSARTYNVYLAGLRTIFRYLIKPAALETNPFAGIEKKTELIASRREFTPEEVTAIFEGFKTGFFYETEVERLTPGRVRKRVKVRRQYKPLYSDEMCVLLNLCCWTGCRGQDGCLMTWENVDLSKSQISYIPRKTANKTNGRMVSLPIHPNLLFALQNALEWRTQNISGEDYILPKVAHRYQTNHFGIQKDVMKIIQYATGNETTVSNFNGRRKLAANKYSLHSFRHSFVSFCANSGVPLAIVSEIVGHGNPAMTRHYSHISNESKQDAIATLPRIESASAVEDSAPIITQITDKLNALSPAQLKTVLDSISKASEASEKP